MFLSHAMCLGAAAVLACGDGSSPVTPADGSSDGGEGDDTTTAPTDTTGDSSGTGDTGTVAMVTYYEDVKPILDARCTACHHEGGIAPFSLTDYEDAQTWAPSVAAAIQAGTMPPWPPNADCNDYLGSRELTDEQIDTIVAWNDVAAPMGDPAKEGPPLTDVDPGLSRVDLSLEMAEPYTPQQSPDDYRCFLVPWSDEFSGDAFVTGFRAVPGNQAIVHHVIAFLATPEQVAAYEDLDAAEAGPGYTCFGGTGGPSRTWLGGWAPGGAGSDLPDGLGLQVPAGSMVILQVHYNTLNGAAEPDQTAIEFKVDESVDKVARVVPFANPGWLAGGMDIPADDPDATHAFQRDVTQLLGGPQTVYTAALHMHTLGDHASLSVERADGSSACMLQIDDWDFHWQGSYGLQAPMQLAPGDEIKLECHFDNTAANQPLVDGVPQQPRDVNWGEGTTDEMCLGIMLLAPT